MKISYLFISLFILPFLPIEGQDLNFNLEQPDMATDTSNWPPPIEYKGDTLYFLIDRNSPNIKFKEFYTGLNNNPKPDYEWTFKSAVCKLENENIEFAFCCWRNPKKYFWAYYHIERKPLSFLDSITYHDEQWLIYHDRSLREIVKSIESGDTVQPPKARILDKGTIANDSITMYEVCLIWREPEGWNDHIEIP